MSPSGEISMEVARNRDKEFAKFRRDFCCYGLGVFLIFSSFGILITLQSSVNIEAGLGVTSIACTYVSAVVSGFSLTPMLIGRFGAKKCILMGTMFHITYDLANFYPRYYTLIPTALLIGIAESNIWTCISIFNAHFGAEYHRIKNHPTKTVEFFVSRLSGYYFAIHHFHHIFGGVITYLILNVFNEQHPPSVMSNVSMTGNSTIFPLYYDITLSFCGANDCQKKTAIDESIENYSPNSRINFMILLSCFTTMCISSLIIHACTLPNVKVHHHQESDENENTIELKKSDINDSKADILIATVGCRDRENSQTVLLENEDDLGLHKSLQVELPGRGKDGVCNGIVANTLKQVGRQLLIPKQLLIIPITLYTGILVGYIFSDLPRSFVSCVSGFSKIGIYACLYGVGHVISPAILGKRGKHLGRIVIFSTSTVLDICNFLFCLLWTPNHDTAWIVYISYVAFGLSDGIWQSTLMVMYTEYFPGRQNVVGATYISIVCLGIAINCAWNTTLCVYMKIYVLLGLLAVGFTLFCIAERLHRRELENEQKR
ncbi:protein unc-93 homolog A-like isoform X1 [Styela clava]